MGLELKAFQAIQPRPPAGARAIRFVAAQMKDIDAIIAAYRARSLSRFQAALKTWADDLGASHAFAAAGARACT
jgi:hypothetical protein